VKWFLAKRLNGAECSDGQQARTGERRFGQKFPKRKFFSRTDRRVRKNKHGMSARHAMRTNRRFGQKLLKTFISK
jgi:hypothetical protein